MKGFNMLTGIKSTIEHLSVAFIGQFGLSCLGWISHIQISFAGCASISVSCKKAK